MGMLSSSWKNLTSIPRRIGVLPEKTKSIEETLGMDEKKKKIRDKRILTGKPLEQF